jgi:tetratricopeptide (TPR) repeat protein
MEMFEGSLDICSRIGNRGRQAGALAGKARVHRLQQDLAQALKEETEARAIFAEIGDKTEVAHVDLRLAELFLDEGKSEQAAVSARRAADVFEKTKGTSDEASANLLLARTLLVDGRIADARKIVDQVKGVAAATHNRELELSAALAAARVRAASGISSETDDSLRRLDRVITDASTTRFEEIALEARLAKGEIEMGTTDSSVGRSYLEALRKDAANEGFQLIAQKASAALQTGRSRPPHGVGN